MRKSRDATEILKFKNSRCFAGFPGIATTLLFFLLCSPFTFGQNYGLKFAYPTTGALELSGSDPNLIYSIHSRAPKFGITGELGLPAGFLLEIDALYSHWSYVSTATGIDTLIRSSTSINAWDFPVLVKRPFFKGTVRPFLSGGAAFRTVNVDTDVSTTVLPATVTVTRTRAPEFVHQATAGLAAGTGIDIRIRKYHIVPEIRYTGFQRDNFLSPSGVFHSNLSQTSFVLGLQRGRQ